MRAQSNLNVSLTPRFLHMVRDQVESGRYQSASEVIREGLRLLEERNQQQELFWAGVRSKVAEGNAELGAGKGIPSEVFLQNMKTHIRGVKAKQKRVGRSSRGK
jgi:antitoxin ParD1/3/4